MIGSLVKNFVRTFNGNSNQYKGILGGNESEEEEDNFGDMMNAIKNNSNLQRADNEPNQEAPEEESEEDEPVKQNSH